MNNAKNSKAAMNKINDEELDVLRDKHSLCAARSGYKIFNGYTLPISYEKIQTKIEEMEVYDDDIWVTSFPKCGTTWTQEMVWCICNNVDLEAATEDLDDRFPFLEFCCVFEMDNLPHKANCVWKSFELVENMKRPRFIKSHLPWELLPKKIRTGEKKPKVIHVVRNPMDTCVSFFYHSGFLESFSGDFNLFWALFMRDKLSWCPYTSNLLGYWKKRDKSNVLVIKFEDMKNDLSAVIRVIMEFLNVKLSEEQVDKLLNHLSFDAMKQNSAVHHAPLAEALKANNLIFDQQGTFIRSGKSGGYKSLMSPEQIESIQKEMMTKFEKEGLTF